MIDAPKPPTPEDCARYVKLGREWPYDGIWHGDELQPLRHAVAPSYNAARAILHNLCDRRGIKFELRAVEHDVREEIVDTVAMIIRECMVTDIGASDD